MRKQYIREEPDTLHGPINTIIHNKTNNLEQIDFVLITMLKTEVVRGNRSYVVFFRVVYRTVGWCVAF